jgi:alpha-ketoglutaric semialdehyde dehydrogenase
VVRNAASGILINGEWVAPEATYEVRNPARPSEVVGEFARAGPEHVDAAYRAARDALAGWRRTPAIQRGEILDRAAQLLAERTEDLATAFTREEGKTIAETRVEVARGAQILRYYAGETAQPRGEVHPSGFSGRFLYSVREPLGVVCLITPWNFPVAIPLWKIAPALAYGNTVVWKPATITPGCAVGVAEALRDAGVPEGVLNLVTGPASAIGGSLTDHEEVDGISFTGSLEIGRQIQLRAIERGVKVQLELGGKNPVVVLPDADLDQAVEQTVRGAMMSAGQKCTATSRAILVGDGAERFVPRLLERVRALRVGDPLRADVDVGPLASAEQLESVLGYLDVARQEGHELAVGGRRLEEEGEGYFVEPTVYLDVDPASRIGREEIFGPVLGVLRAASLGEALEIANSVEFGLSASIFTRDIREAFQFIDAVEAGVVHVNSETAGAEPQVPFGGVKASSSHSREQGKAAAEFYTRLKTVYLDMPPAQEPSRPPR